MRARISAWWTSRSIGESGDVDDLYRRFGIDTDTIVGAALDLLP